MDLPQVGVTQETRPLMVLGTVVVQQMHVVGVRVRAADVCPFSFTPTFDVGRLICTPREEDEVLVSLLETRGQEPLVGIELTNVETCPALQVRRAG